MATRFYLHSGSGGQIGAAASGWQTLSPPPFQQRVLRPVIGDRSFQTVAYPEVSASQGNRMCEQFVSNPLAFQIIPTGTTFKGQIRGLQSVAGMDARVQLNIRLLSGDGLTHRKTLFALDNTASVGAEEFALTLTNRQIPYGGPGAVLADFWNVTEGDRLFIDLGYRYHNTDATSMSCSFELGDPTSASDLPEDNTDTTQKRPWIEFTHDFVFLDQPEFVVNYNPTTWPDGTEQFSFGNQYAVVDYPKRKGTKAAMFKVRPGDVFGGAERIEGKWNDSREDRLEGQWRYYGGSRFFAAPWTDFTDFGIFLQWHEVTAAFIQPLMALQVLATDAGGPGLVAVFHTGEHPSANVYQYDNSHPVSRATPIGVWMDWKLSVLWEWDYTGEFKWELRFDGGDWQTVLWLKNVPTLGVILGVPDYVSALYLKGGLYRAAESFTSLTYLDEDIADQNREWVDNNFGPTALRAMDPDRNPGFLTGHDPTEPEASRDAPVPSMQPMLTA